jgi:hypothetical protein
MGLVAVGLFVGTLVVSLANAGVCDAAHQCSISTGPTDAYDLGGVPVVIPAGSQLRFEPDLDPEPTGRTRAAEAVLCKHLTSITWRTPDGHEYHGSVWERVPTASTTTISLCKEN